MRKIRERRKMVKVKAKGTRSRGIMPPMGGAMNCSFEVLWNLNTSLIIVIPPTKILAMAREREQVQETLVRNT